MSKIVTLRIEEEVYESFLKRAQAENRTLSNFIETAVKERIQECDFVDDFEMAEIQENENLTHRLKKGSRDAEKKRGKMIG